MALDITEALQAYANACAEDQRPSSAHIAAMCRKAIEEIKTGRAYQSSYEQLTDEFCKMDQAITALSQTWTEHPKMPNGELWDGPCQCRECCSYEPAEDE